MNFEEFQNKYNIRSNFLEFYGVTKAIHFFIKQTEIDMNNAKIFNVLKPFNLKIITKSRTGCKHIYSSMLKEVVPTCHLKWEDKLSTNISKSEWKHIHKLPFITCASSKLKWFQYRIINRILGTNKLLYIMGERNDSLCTFCHNETETIIHIFWQCEIVNDFIELFCNWLYVEFGILINVNVIDFLLGKKINKLYDIPMDEILYI